MNDFGPAEMRRAIARKRDGAALDDGAWHGMVRGLLDGTIDDAQCAALLMACVLRGLDAAETRALTEAFVASGERLEAPAGTADKHSSGGVGDTASLIVVPWVAACGVPVAKLSGRALGHTGGTLDKIEAIEGVRTDLEPERFFACVREAGCAIAAQSARLVPADKRIYTLRDRTSTVPSQGLIAASIVSKKIAGGAHVIVYDVKFGNGAFLPEADAASALARTLVDLTHAFGRRAAAVVSDMNEPLGPAIGTGLEAIEARDFLDGTRRDARLHDVCRTLALTMLALAGRDEPERLLANALDSGAAFERFERMLATQGATAGALQRLAPHPTCVTLRAARDGYVAGFDLVSLGERARDLVVAGGGGAGVRITVRTGDAVRAGDPLGELFGDPAYEAAVVETISLSDESPEPRPLVAAEIGSPESRSTLERK